MCECVHVCTEGDQAEVGNPEVMTGGQVENDRVWDDTGFSHFTGILTIMVFTLSFGRIIK